MRIRVFALDFRIQDGMAVPADPNLHRLAVEFAEHELAAPVNFTDFKKLWVACQVDDNEQPVHVEGLLGMVLRADFPMARFVSPGAAKKLIDRANDYLHDQGARGAEVFLFISSKEDDSQRCPQYQDWLRYVGAKPADRFAVTVR
jgi:hypothetical protein